MKLSVLIPTFNAEKYIFSLLSALFSQKINLEVEIIIVDSSSTDNTLKIITSSFPEVKTKVIHNKQFDHGGTRNFLASLASGDLLLFMTQDAIPIDDYLFDKLVQPLIKDSHIAVSYARQIPKPEASTLERFARNFNYPNISILKSKDSLKELGIKTFFNSNVCSLYRKKVFEEMGGFPENIILNEDMIFASKSILKGHKVFYNSEAKVNHSHNYSYNQQFKRYFDIGMAFKETNYLLKIASNEKEGFKMIRNQIRYLLLNKEYKYIIVALIENFIKLIAYNLGKKHEIIPIKIKRKISAYLK
ncbi:glycosyltransferase family 2 protein [Neobacillus sp. OS1-33]|uniref:glycosyltransferase family 2 protein n=1 Tax=Neobacillus sp. OS1-33 TaxID=3070683 RepID=UPI0027DF9548|nr:glycosyltransferase family 2 protein [Neobacillus sp. OS1-33]WML24558.1 glycosyltransferase family 2 protein [Neobacillus sp. OS1-33]